MNDPSRSKKITVKIDKNLDKKIRLKQAKIIRKTKSGISFSQVVNEILRKGLKNEVGKHD